MAADWFMIGCGGAAIIGICDASGKTSGDTRGRPAALAARGPGGCDDDAVGAGANVAVFDDAAAVSAATGARGCACASIESADSGFADEGVAAAAAPSTTTAIR